ncbi:unnamed protein product [Bursaphelenchus okinawaensis]|uniref:Uncharacterized protein n=1 Tax=Bursaphelenchus okinawaensis TaxID=465554 RepID=A0A811K921_9BILA|nr:unnamed protein product [Bursaphelenchus okinawaensis]CAG9097055.1 unnamed protein product [Bursaphelenchus okinawaensis]
MNELLIPVYAQLFLICLATLTQLASGCGGKKNTQPKPAPPTPGVKPAAAPPPPAAAKSTGDKSKKDEKKNGSKKEKKDDKKDDDDEDGYDKYEDVTVDDINPPQ